MSASVPTSRVDIRTEVCPMTYVRIKLALEVLQPGEVLEVHLLGDEPRRNVPASAQDDGHSVLALVPQEDGSFLLWLRKGG